MIPRKATAERSTYKGQTQFYPVVKFYTSVTGWDSFYLNNPQPTRSKALTVARQYIRNQDNS